MTPLSLTNTLGQTEASICFGKQIYITQKMKRKKEKYDIPSVCSLFFIVFTGMVKRKTNASVNVFLSVSI